MSEHRDEKWLDDQIRKVVGGEAPEFDAEQWKRAFPAEYEVLASRSSEGRSSGASKVWVFRHRWTIARVAVAAAIVVVSATLLLTIGPSEPPREEPELSASDVPTLGSLRTAYRQGGLAALDERFDEASRKLVTGPEAVSLAGWLNGT
jgi:hypothetical protein